MFLNKSEREIQRRNVSEMLSVPDQRIYRRSEIGQNHMSDNLSTQELASQLPKARSPTFDRGKNMPHQLPAIR
jgi:hypothetical protein